jgi:alcohol dehydrogenase class IV
MLSVGLFYSLAQTLDFPLIAMPMTSGTGMESYIGVVSTDQSARSKFALADQKNAPKVALTNPEMTRSVPRHALYDLPHGLSRGILFPHAFEFNSKGPPEKAQRVFHNLRYIEEQGWKTKIEETPDTGHFRSLNDLLQRIGVALRFLDQRRRPCPYR